jgi:leucyl-tRNA synthetase
LILKCDRELGSGRHDRSGQRTGDRRQRLAVSAEVERKDLTQWFFKVSDYADELLEAPDGLDNWPAKVKLTRQNGSAKSRGLQFAFSLLKTSADVTGFESLQPVRLHGRVVCRHFARPPDHKRWVG